MVDIHEVKEYINQNLRTVHRLDDVASHFKVSPETLRKQFRRKERISFSNYVTKTRVEEMKQRLANSNEYCFEICFDVGFGREDSAAKTFKRLTGVSMEQYRTLNSNGRE